MINAFSYRVNINQTNYCELFFLQARVIVSSDRGIDFMISDAESLVDLWTSNFESNVNVLSPTQSYINEFSKERKGKIVLFSTRDLQYIEQELKKIADPRRLTKTIERILS